jgi:glucose-6-phosphate isomerase
MSSIPTGLRVAGGLDPAAFERRLTTLGIQHFQARLWAHDDTLWGDDPAHRAVAANRLGWLDSPAKMREAIDDLRAFAAEVVEFGFTHAVLLGMGGSSLAPEVLRRTFGVATDGLELTVLDNTSPAAVRAIDRSHDPKRTLFVVSSKSGGTIEVNSFEKHFFEWVSAVRGASTGQSFVAITDPHTSLEVLAGNRGYRRTFLNPPDIGGRYSALSYFGMVPAALIGVDLDALLAGAAQEAERSGPKVLPRANPGIALGAALGELALAGRDKLTLVLGGGLEPLGVWIEQLVAESTGKNGTGIVPIADEPLAEPEAYGDDRMFVAIHAGARNAATDSKLDELERAGHPVLHATRGSIDELGGEFLRWEIATATAGAVLKVDPFDEPNVSEAKQATQAQLKYFLDHGAFIEPTPVSTGSPVAYVPGSIAETLIPRLEGDTSASAWVGALLALAKPGDYFALLAYLHRTPERHEKLERLRLAARSATRLATTLGYGPRFLHSTGQLHKGGPNTGIFLQITAEEGEDLPIPGERHGFAALRHAQANGDYEVLERRGRRLMRVHLGTEPDRGLDTLIAAIESRARS